MKIHRAIRSGRVRRHRVVSGVQNGVGLVFRGMVTGGESWKVDIANLGRRY